MSRPSSAGYTSPHRLLLRAWKLLTTDQKRRISLLAGAMGFTAILEVVGIGLILPFLSVVTDPSLIQSNELLALAYDALGFSSTTAFLIALGVGVLLFVLVVNAISLLAVWLQMRFVNGLNHDLSVRLMGRYLDRPYSAFLDENTNDLNTHILSEASSVVNGIYKPGLILLSKTMISVAIVGLLFAVEPYITLGVFAIIGGMYAAFYMKVRRKLRHIGTERVKENRGRYKTTGEAFGGIKDVKILGREGYFLDQYREPSRQYAKYNVINGFLNQAPRYLIQGLTFGGIMAILLILLARGEGISGAVPILGLFAAAGYRILPAVQSIVSSLTSFKFNEAIFDELEGALSLEDSSETSLPSNRSDVEPLPFEQEFGLYGVTFTYENADEPVLEDLTLEIPKDAHVGIVGATGAGKTTIVDLIMGLLSPQEGHLEVDGRVITSENVSRWQQNIGYIPQKIFLADDTVARNIAFGLPDEEIDMERVREAAQVAHIDDFVAEELPEGYQTPVGEEGVRLSGGQRQRIGIARALYHDPEVLILDEATSDIDNATQSSITDAIQQISGEKTLIVVAHRFSTIRNCDILYMVGLAGIDAKGTYEELIQESPAFQHLAQAAKRR